MTFCSSAGRQSAWSRPRKETLGQSITAAGDQTEEYTHAKLKWVNNDEPLPFLYEATGVLTRFTDIRDPKPRSRELFTFHRPEMLKSWLEAGSSLRSRIYEMPSLNPDEKPPRELGLRDCQERAIVESGLGSLRTAIATLTQEEIDHR